MGFCTEAEYWEFMRQAPEFERQLIRSGTHLIKFWFSVSREEQQRRFAEREAHPLKQWKLSPIDLASLDKWDAYTAAKEEMFRHTDLDESPWIVIKSDCKKRARLNAMRFVLHRLNRAEYANTIRDLLALDIDVESLLPPDDSAYGFDNIADMLGVSPSLQEHYLTAALKVAALAVGDPLQPPTSQTWRIRQDLSQDRHVEGLPLGTVGGTSATP